MLVAYLTSEYPKLSHSFIRREIRALEELGLQVLRLSIRVPGEQSPDPSDREEGQRTRAVLAGGASGLLVGVAWALARHPLRTVSALALALRLGRRAERGLLVHAAYFAEACVVARWMSAAGTSHVHAHFGSNPAMVAMLVAAVTGGSFSFTVHGTVETDSPLAISLPEKVARARFVAAVSDYGRSQLCRWVDARHWSKIHVVRCGVDASYLEPPEHAFNESQQLVCVGRLSPEKGQLVLLRAFARIAADFPAARLVLAGDGEMRGLIEQEIRDRGLADQVSITGWLSGSEVRRCIVQSRALVLPSFAEGLPVVLMEALASSRPVVASWVAGIPELVVHGENGWMVPPGDDLTLANALRESLIASASELARRGAAGRARVLVNHDVSRSAQRMATLFMDGQGRVDPSQPVFARQMSAASGAKS